MTDLQEVRVAAYGSPTLWGTRIGWARFGSGPNASRARDGTDVESTAPASPPPEAAGRRPNRPKTGSRTPSVTLDSVSVLRRTWMRRGRGGTLGGGAPRAPP